MLNVKRTSVYDVTKVFKRMVYQDADISIPYGLYIPKNYDCGETYPLLVFLHGAGERGNDNEKQLAVAIQKMFDSVDSPVYDSIVIAPQCPDERQWVMTPWEKGNYSVVDTPESPELEAVCGLIRDIICDYNVDKNRIYVTGISMGGFGTWDMLCRHGNRIAAGMPVCGAGDPSFARKLKNIPIRTFHGSDDGAVPPSGTRKMFASIKKAGGKCISYTEFDGMGHNVWDNVYEDVDNLKWLFSQNLADRKKKEEADSKKMKIVAGVAGGVAASVLAGIVAVLAKKKTK